MSDPAASSDAAVSRPSRARPTAQSSGPAGGGRHTDWADTSPDSVPPGAVADRGASLAGPDPHPGYDRWGRTNDGYTPDPEGTGPAAETARG